MSLLAELSPYPGSRKKRKLLGRGRGAGKGGTSGKGHKGQKARKGAGIPPGFEGGGMPLSRRLPKFGFTNARFKKEWDIVNFSRLRELFAQNAKNAKSGKSGGNEPTEITPDILKAKGAVSGRKPVRILGKAGKGPEAKLPLFVKAHHISAGAKLLIEKAGGKFEILPLSPRRGLSSRGPSGRGASRRPPSGSSRSGTARKSASQEPVLKQAAAKQKKAEKTSRAAETQAKK